MIQNHISLTLQIFLQFPQIIIHSYYNTVSIVHQKVIVKMRILNTLLVHTLIIFFKARTQTTLLFIREELLHIVGGALLEVVRGVRLIYVCVGCILAQLIRIYLSIRLFEFRSIRKSNLSRTDNVRLIQLVIITHIQHIGRISPRIIIRY